MTPPRLGTSCPAGMSPTTRVVAACLVAIAVIVGIVIFGG